VREQAGRWPDCEAQTRLSVVGGGSRSPETPGSARPYIPVLLCEIDERLVWLYNRNIIKSPLAAFLRWNTVKMFFYRRSFI